MSKTFDAAANRILDEIIRARRTNRAFAPEAPPREMIAQIIEAGLWAPFAALSVGGREDFRRFFVFTRGSEAIAQADNLLRRRAQAALEKMREAGERDPQAAARGAAYRGRLQALAEKGHPALKAAPYFIVVAEYQGVPRSGLQSLAHTLQNMWLKATAMGLAFQLVSAVENLAEDEDFVKRLGVPFGSYVLDGCVVGYPAADPAPAKRQDVETATRWL